MNIIRQQPIPSLGYGFVEPQYIPAGQDEYYLRNEQNKSGIRYRKLRKSEIRQLEANQNSSDNWNRVLVADEFDPKLVKRCNFFGLVRIGKLQPFFLEFNNLRLPVGLYDSTIISSDIGNNVVIDNVNYLSHYIIGNDVILANVNELAATDHSKFGNGVIKTGEKESVRVWMEICNENGGRSVLPFNGMLSSDAWIWSKFRDDEELLNRFRQFTDQQFDLRRGDYGVIGDRTVIKNCRIIKDVWVGTDAYIKGANKLKNLTINSSEKASSQIGEGCELVNGIVGYGCRIFYGVKAVRFMMGSNAQLKYGARLINSFLGDNSTISCCEVLNSLIFPAHEQHHNNSFLCAATIMGQSNMAAGATVGSNHNSRGADGEIVAGRGFWPGLCVSLKHNSRFACFTLLAKGDYPAELNIPIPFSLVSHDVPHDRLQIMPGYWFLYNMYALARNAGKYSSRDKRVNKEQVLEYDYLAPDSVNEMFSSLRLFAEATAGAWAAAKKKKIAPKDLYKTGAELLEKKPDEVRKLTITLRGMENSKRDVVLLKAPEAWAAFREQIFYYGIMQVIDFIREKKIQSAAELTEKINSPAQRQTWLNTGGQLIPEEELKALLVKIRNGKVKSWNEIHQFYSRKSKQYPADKRAHAWASLLEITGTAPSRVTNRKITEWLKKAVDIRTRLVAAIHHSRARDYENPFRQMVYESIGEMEKVIGKLSENPFILEQEASLGEFRKNTGELISRFS